MGKSYTPTFRLEIRDSRMTTTNRWTGRATAKRLEQFIFGYAKSLEAGGANEHLSKSLGFIPYPLEARIIRQSTGQVEAVWKAAIFQVF